MNLKSWKLLIAVCIASAICLAPTAAWAQKTEAKAETPAKKPTHRLPAHFGDLVDGVQKTKIYALQDQYGPQIEALTAQIKSLQQKRDAEIEGVLTPEQKAKLDQSRAAAKAKAAERAAAIKAANEKAAAEKAAAAKTTGASTTSAGTAAAPKPVK